MATYYRHANDPQAAGFFTVKDGRIVSTDFTQLAYDAIQNKDPLALQRFGNTVSMVNGVPTYMSGQQATGNIPVQSDYVALAKELLKRDYGIDYETAPQMQQGDLAAQLGRQAGLPEGMWNLFGMPEDRTNKYGTTSVGYKDFFGNKLPNLTAPTFDQNAVNQTIANNAQAAIKAGLVTPQQAQANQTLAGSTNPNTVANTQPKWINPVTGQVTAVGVGMPATTSPVGAYIPNEQALQAKRQELVAAGVPQAEWSKFISAPDASGKLYWTQPATLTSPTGQKKVVASGSQEASQLLNSGWTLGDKVGGGTVTSNLLSPTTPLDIGSDTTSPTYNADVVSGGAKADTTTIDAEIKRLKELLTPPETDLSNSVSKLLKDLETGADTLTGRGATQLSEEEKQGVQAKIQALTAKNGELKTKLAEIDALTASYQLANQQEEGRPQTLSRLQGAQAQNYKMYLAQKNLLTSEASFIQSEALSLAGQAEAAQKAADRAVDLLYADRESAYNAKIAKLNILLPQLEKEEARYAGAVQMYLQNQATALSEAKQNKKDITSVKLQAISAGITDASVLTKIGNAKSYDEALQILGTSMPKVAKVPETREVGGNLYQWNPTTGKWDLTIQDSESDLLGGLSEQQISILNNMQNQIRQDADIKGFIDVRQSYNRILSTGNNPSAAGDLALIFNYMKMLDPGSTVREGEFANAQNSAGIPERIRAKYNQVINGERLAEDQRADFLGQAKNLYESQLGTYKDAVSFYKNQADTFGIPQNLVLRNFEGVNGSSKTLPQINRSFGSLPELLKSYPDYYDTVEKMLFENPDLEDKDIIDILTFSPVGGDTKIKPLKIGSTTVNVDESIASKLAMADRDFFKATGRHLQVNQSFRTSGEQARLYNELSAKGARVAPPGSSFHEKGLAVDVTNWQEAERYLRKYGFQNELEDDKGHFSIGEFA